MPGVYIELEAIALNREIPAAVCGTLLSPILRVSKLAPVRDCGAREPKPDHQRRRVSPNQPSGQERDCLK
jgi:hypothetical protein